MTIYWAMFALFALAAFTFNPAIAGHSEQPRQTRATSLAPLLAALFLIVIIGLRYHVGGDWHNYELDFERSHYETFGSLLSQRKEPGYALAVWLAATLDSDIWLINLILAVPFCWGLIQLCRQQPNPWLSLLVATPFLIIVIGMGFSRQAAALGFLMAGLALFIRTGSLTGFILLAFAGSFFHRTVLVFVPIVIIATGRSKFVSAILCVVAVVLIYFTVISSSIEYYSQGYLQGRFDAAGATVRVLMNVLPAIIVLLAKDRFYRDPREKMVWRTFAILSLMSGVALPLVSSSVIVDRLAMYLIPLQMFVLGRLPIVASPNGQPSVAWRMAVIGYSAAVLYVWLTYGHYSAGWLPYQNYLWSQTSPAA
jgi:EpsG family